MTTDITATMQDCNADRWLAHQRHLVGKVQEHPRWKGSPLQRAYGSEKALWVWARILAPFIGGPELPINDQLITFVTHGPKDESNLVEVRVEAVTVTRPGPADTDLNYTLEVGVDCDEERPRAAEVYVQLYHAVSTPQSPPRTQDGIRTVMCPPAPDLGIPAHIVIHRWDDRERGHTPTTHAEQFPGDNKDVSAVSEALSMWLASQYDLPVV